MEQRRSQGSLCPHLPGLPSGKRSVRLVLAPESFFFQHLPTKRTPWAPEAACPGARETPPSPGSVHGLGTQECKLWLPVVSPSGQLRCITGLRGICRGYFPRTWPEAPGELAPSPLQPSPWSASSGSHAHGNPRCKHQGSCFWGA